jgi:hypothetical protein
MIVVSAPKMPAFRTWRRTPTCWISLSLAVAGLPPILSLIPSLDG